MRVLIVSVIAVIAAVGCGGRVNDDTGAGRGRVSGGEGEADAGPQAASTDAASSADATPVPTVPPAADAGSWDPAETVPADGTLDEVCTVGDLGATHPETFGSLLYLREQPDCGGRGLCTTLVMLDAKCKATLGNAAGDRLEVTIGASDCLALATWLTSERLHAALGDPKLCEGTVAKVNPDLTEIDRGKGRLGFKTANECTAPVLEHHRACMQRLLDVYRPGTTL